MEVDMTDFTALHERAAAAALAAAKAAIPARFNVVERANPFDDNSAVVRAYDNGGRGYEDEGGASLRFGGNTSFGRWLKAQGEVPVTHFDHYSGQEYPRNAPVRKNHYRGGIGFGVMVRGYERSVAAARAYVAVINEALPTTGKPVATYDAYID